MLPSPDLLSVALGDRLALADVTAVNDPERLGRVEVRLWGLQGFDGQVLKAWARVAVPFAGPGRGAFFLPGVGDEVLVGFVAGDPRHPVVLGSLWNGGQRPPDSLGGDRSSIDRWSLTTKAGTRIAVVEEANSPPRLTLNTPGGVTVELDDVGEGRLTCRVGGTTVTLESESVTVDTDGPATIDAGEVEIKAGHVLVSTATATFSGIVECDTLQAVTVMAGTYACGIGNVW
jgi:uncharacterized protein involved in type VI secretion and phage assembly